MPPPDRRTRSWTVPLTHAGLASIEADLQAFLDEHALDAHASYVTRLVVEELIVNLVVHGTGAADAQATVGVTITPATSRIVVLDDEVPFDPSTAPALDVSADLDHRRPGGMGLHLVRELTDELTYERVDGRNRLVAEVRRAV